MSTTPRLLGEYELQELVGRGPLTEVWKAVDRRQNRYVTIKLFHLQPALQDDTDFVAQCQSEARVIASLHYQNVVQMHNFQVVQPPESTGITAYIVMDYVEGQSLATYLMNTTHMGRFLPPAEVIQLLQPIGAAIDYAHQQGIVHGDIKPTNILLTRSVSFSMPMPMLTDFGIVQLLKAVNWPLRSASYIAPEQAQGNIGSERSDLYALGVILYELFTGTLPFEGNDPSDTIKQLLSTTLTPPTLINPNILPGVAAIIIRSVNKDAASRYTSAGAMIANLARVLNVPLAETNSQNDPNDSMNRSTFIIPGRSASIIPPTPIPPVPPSFNGSGKQESPVSMTPPGILAPPPDRSSIGQSSRDSEHPSMNMSWPWPMSPVRDKVTSIPSDVSESSTFLPEPPTKETVKVSFPGIARGQGEREESKATSIPGRPPQRGRRPLLIALIALLIMVLLSSGIGTYLMLFSHGSAAPLATPIVGRAFFVSSGLVSTNPGDSQGITDEVQINVQTLPPPPSGKAYYAWLLNDIHQAWKPIYLGKLAFHTDGTAALTYQGNASHSNLLATNSRFLLTEGKADVLPALPSATNDSRTWLYYAAFSQAFNTKDPTHFSLYDHIRHLLSSDPTLATNNLTGGLDIWLYRNTEKIMEWSGSARDAWGKNQAIELMRRQLLRILTYLDGRAYIKTELPDAPSIFDGNQTALDITKIAMFNRTCQTSPASSDYLSHTARHLNEISLSSYATTDQKEHAAQIEQDIVNICGWFQAVHDDALQLYKMSDNQLLSKAALPVLSDLAEQANEAFFGQPDPNNPGANQDGAVQLHYTIQNLATFEIRACTASDPCTGV